MDFSNLSPEQLFSSDHKSKLNSLIRKNIKNANKGNKVCSGGAQIDITEAVIGLFNWYLVKFSQIYEFKKTEHANNKKLSCMLSAVNTIYADTIKTIKATKVFSNVIYDNKHYKANSDVLEEVRKMVGMFDTDFSNKKENFCSKKFLSKVIYKKGTIFDGVFDFHAEIEAKVKHKSTQQFIDRLNENINAYCLPKYTVSVTGEILGDLE